MHTAEDPINVSKLSSVCEKQLSAKCKPHTLAYCPTMDLIALATEDDQVHVFRFNGQEALGGPSGKSGVTVKGTKWKINGRMLAVAGSDNNVRLISASSGKTVHDLPCGPPHTNEGASISCVSWGVHLTDGKRRLESLLRGSDDKRTLNDILSASTISAHQLSSLKADLPRELALLDIERSLPKLSVLPSTGDDDDVFSSRQSLDSMFDASNKDSNDEVDVLLAGFDDGTVHLRIFDCFDIGSLNVCSSFPGTENCRALRHSSSPFSSTHSLLLSVSVPESNRFQLRLLTLDLLFITKSGEYLSLLASKITQLQNLLRYIKQVQNQIYLEWKNAQDLPSRYMANVNEDLQEKCQCDFVTAAYHLIVTGDCFEPVKDFLVDQIGERGHKRWEKAVGSGYETLRRLTHECLLPALERCGVILSRLVGLSKYHRLSPVLGLETTDLKECLESVDSLNLLSHKVLIHSSREYQEFWAFSKWMRHEIDLQAADPLSTTAEEEMEKSDTIDFTLTLNYIQGAMTRSSLLDFISPASPETHQGEANVSPEQNGSFYESYKKQLRQQEQQKPEERLALPKLSDLVCRLKSQCDKVFRQIADTQRRGILHRSPLVFSSDCDEDVVDMRMGVVTHENDALDTVRIASKSKKFPYRFYTYRIILDTVNGVSSTRDIHVSCVSLQAGNIQSLKFVEEDDALMILWRDASPSALMHLVKLPMREYLGCEPKKGTQLDPADAVEGGFPKHWEQSEDLITQIDLLDPNREDDFIRHTFDSQKDAEPESLEVNGREGRRAVCVLYSDGLRYSVFDMDSAHDGEEDEDGGQEEDGEYDDHEV